MRAALLSCSTLPARALIRRGYIQHGFQVQWQRYAASGVPIQPKTYFQDEPQPSSSQPQQEPRRKGSRLIWRFVRGSIVAALAFATGLATQVEIQRRLEEEDADVAIDVQEQSISTSDIASFARFSNGVPAFAGNGLPAAPHAYSALFDTITHHCVVASNLMCEDHANASQIGEHMGYWGIYDGHAGDSCSRLLASILPIATSRMLFNMETLNSRLPFHKQKLKIDVEDVLRNIFLAVDNDLLADAQDVLTTGDEQSETLGAVYSASAGSCALVCLYDPIVSNLWIANAGDSRAVLGRWDEAQQKYVAIPLSEDHTGFNKKEVQRLEAEHPGEKVIDPQTGRVLGLAVTRAFGDTRWKWPDQLNQLAHEKYGTHAPRPGQVVKTPPYVTAEPEVRSIEIQTEGDKPDFLIMASDGLWDRLSSDDAVKCVDLWSSQITPVEATTQLVQPDGARERTSVPASTSERASMDKSSQRPQPADEDFDANNCAAHLIQNALGGSDPSQAEYLTRVPPPFSRNLFDDISVFVVFFKQDTSALPPPLRPPE